MDIASSVVRTMPKRGCYVKCIIRIERVFFKDSITICRVREVTSLEEKIEALIKLARQQVGYSMEITNVSVS